MNSSYFKLFKSLSRLFCFAFISILTVLIFIYSFFDLSKLFDIPNEQPSAVVLFISLTAVLTGIMLQRQTAIEKNTLDFEEKYLQDEKTAENFSLVLKICHESEESIVVIANS